MFFLGACSSVPVYKTDRHGLLDRLIAMDKGRPVHHRSESDPELESLRGETSNWQWPLKHVKVTSPFGKRSGRFHEGVDLKAGVGTPVYAAGPGRVVYAGSKISGYGKMVVIEHPGSLYSVYAHNSRNLVKPGQKVKKGRKIAVSGRSGRVSGPHLHFEIRSPSHALDPLAVLPMQARKSKKTFVR